MRDKNRIDEVLEELEEYWKENPDLRLSQIVGNAGQDRGYGTDPYHMEDDEILSYLEENN